MTYNPKNKENRKSMVPQNITKIEIYQNQENKPITKIDKVDIEKLKL